MNEEIINDTMRHAGVVVSVKILDAAKVLAEVQAADGGLTYYEVSRHPAYIPARQGQPPTASNTAHDD